MGGALEAIKSGYMKSELVRSQSSRLKIMAGEIPVVGRNMFTEGIDSPLLAGDGGIFKVDQSRPGKPLNY